MKPVNKTRRTTEHASMLEETRVYCKNARRIIRVSEKRSSRKADRFASKRLILFELKQDHGKDYEPEHDALVRYQDGFRVWWR